MRTLGFVFFLNGARVQNGHRDKAKHVKTLFELPVVTGETSIFIGFQGPPAGLFTLISSRKPHPRLLGFISLQALPLMFPVSGGLFLVLD